jgi:hypothetical protein
VKRLGAFAVLCVKEEGEGGMKIQEQDVYHGAALTQIVEHPSFKALNRASTKYGHYQINADRQVFVKYRKTNASSWTFTFQPSEVRALASALSGPSKVYLCLVCGKTTICALTASEIAQVIQVQPASNQWIRVDLPKGGSLRVSGSCGKLSRTVPHKSFPEKVFN